MIQQYAILFRPHYPQHNKTPFAFSLTYEYHHSHSSPLTNIIIRVCPLRVCLIRIQNGFIINNTNNIHSYSTIWMSTSTNHEINSHITPTIVSIPISYKAFVLIHDSIIYSSNQSFPRFHKNTIFLINLETSIFIYVLSIKHMINI